MIKSAKFMKQDSALYALKEMFIVGGKPFSVSIHDSRGRYWLKPTDTSNLTEIKHNKKLNWHPYKGEPEQLA